MFEAMALTVMLFAGADSSAELKQLDMVNSPIMPGGTLGLTLNPRKIWSGNITKDKYIKMMLAADEDISKLNSNPTPSKHYREDLQDLKNRKRDYYAAKFDEIDADFRQRTHQ